MFQNERIICEYNVSKRDNYIQIECFKTRELYANIMFQNETVKIRIKCFKTGQLYIDKMFQNETIICA